MSLTVHHLHVSQSERIPWLCEELGIDYDLKTYNRAPLMAPPEYKALHPAGTAPIIQNGSLTLAESCACIEYICHKHGEGKLFLPPTHPAYADFLYWWHWADGTLMPGLSRLLAAHSGGLGDDNMMVAFANDRFKRAMGSLNERLSDNEWIAGDEFTVADIMAVFPLTTFRHFYPYSLQEQGNILKYLERIGGRKAYQKAMKKCDPEMELVLGPDPPKKAHV
jgi:glutathione S-transferase